MNRMRNLLAAAVVIAGIGAALRPSTASAEPTRADLLSAIPDVAERVVDSVVNISTTHIVKGTNTDPWFTDPDSPGYEEQSDHKEKSLGSGVIVTATGRILTNSHVIDGADSIRVTLPDGNEVDAKIVGNDPQADLAVIQLEGKLPPLKPLAFGDSSALRLGEIVLAVGDPMNVGKSVTMGIVSAKGRAGMHIEDYEDFIQTDAAINPGNSGGALVNMKGELVGINTAIASKSGGYMGIGFAIPTNMAQPIMDMLVKTGKVTRGYIGVSLDTATPEIATKFKLGASRGALIMGVEAGTPGAKAGLEAGDVVTALDKVEIKTGDALRNTIAMRAPGSVVELEVVHRDTGTGTAGRALMKVKLGERPDMQKANLQPKPQRRRR